MRLESRSLESFMLTICNHVKCSQEVIRTIDKALLEANRIK